MASEEMDIDCLQKILILLSPGRTLGTPRDSPSPSLKTKEELLKRLGSFSYSRIHLFSFSAKRVLRTKAVVKHTESLQFFKRVSYVRGLYVCSV